MGGFGSRGLVAHSPNPGGCVGIRGLSLFRRTGCFLARSNSHSVAARDGCTNIPLAAVGLRKTGPFSRMRLFKPSLEAVRPPGSARTDQVLEDFEDSVCVYRQAAIITAPSMMTPAVTYFHSATSSFRASATMVVFLRRPPLRLTRSSNHRAKGRLRLMAQP